VPVEAVRPSTRQARPLAHGVHRKVWAPPFVSVNATTPVFPVPEKYVPIGQFEPTMDPARQYWPAGHGPPVDVTEGCTALVAVVVQYEPAAQFPVGAKRPVVAQYFPASHAVHSPEAVKFVDVEYLPAGQGVGFVDPVGQ